MGTLWVADFTIPTADSAFYTADGGYIGPVDEWSARQNIVQAGLEVFVQYADSPSVPAGYVITQTPAKGTIVAPNSVVTITVSGGVEPALGSVTVPNVVGLTWKPAYDALAAANCSLDKYLFAVNAAAPGTVLTQSLASGGSVVPGTKVQLTLSAGPAKVASTVSVPAAS